MVLDELEDLLLEALANLKLGARTHLPVLGKNGVRDVQPRRFGDREEEDCALGSSALLFPGAGSFCDLVDLPVGELVRALPLRFLANDSEHLRLRGGAAHIIPDVEQHRFGRAALLDNNRTALIFNPAQELAKTCARAQRGDDSRLNWGGAGSPAQATSLPHGLLPLPSESRGSCVRSLPA